MKHFGMHRLSILGLALITLAVSTSLSYGALNVYLKLKGTNGKSYVAHVKADGSFAFSNVPPGTYDLVLVCDDGNTPDPPSAIAAKGKDKGHVEVLSWSWGATNSGSIAPSPTSGTGQTSEAKISKESTWKEQNVANRTPISLSDMNCQGHQCEKIIHRDLALRSACAPSGKLKIDSFTIKQ